MSDLKRTLIECLKAQGADLVGFADAAAFRDTAVPKLMPEAKTVIVAAFRVLRGAHRGIEDGSTYYQYSTMGVRTMEENVMPRALLRACALLDDLGYAALPQRRHPTVMAEEGGTNPEVDYEEIMRGRFTEVELDFDEAAVRAGLGEKGLHGALITEEYGPLVRLCAILTDAEIEPDPAKAPRLCDRCGECLRACPGGALDGTGNRDDWQCAVYYNGANMLKNPFLPADAFCEDPERLAIIAGEARLSPERAREAIRQILYYPPAGEGYSASICGHACRRACMVHLEETGKLAKTYEAPFRRQPEWELPLL